MLNGDTTNALFDTDLFETEIGIQLPTFFSIVEVEMVDVFINSMYNGLLISNHCLDPGKVGTLTYSNLC